MDYDDNDVSRHNLQLAGEGRSRSSSVLRPYDFPKFDFDDSLQGHLRFDSLVETEVFLGIRSQEDNQWIEDFSRVSNGMEFNSNPADSCSISRRNNVWSEATSSESVEMLLKSVGQDEMMPGATINSDSNACEDQGTLIEHREPGSKLDERIHVYVANLEDTLTRGDILKDCPSSEELMEEPLPEVKQPLDHTIGSSGNLTQITGSSNDGTSRDEEKNCYHDEFKAENSEECETSGEKSTNCGPGDESLHFTKTVDNIDSSIGLLNTSEASQQVNVVFSHERCNDEGEEKLVLSGEEQEETTILEVKTGEAGIHIHSVGSCVCLVPEAGVVNSGNAIEGSLDCVGEYTSISIKEESGLKSSQTDDKDRSFSISTSVQTGKHEGEVFPVNTKKADLFEGFQVGSTVDGIDQNSAKLGSLNAGHSANLGEKIDSAVQSNYREDNDKMEDKPGSPPKTENVSETTFFSMEDKNLYVERSGLTDNTNVNTSDEAVLSSTAGNKLTENVEGCHNDSIVTREESGVHFMDDSRQVTAENLAHMQADFSESGLGIVETKEEDKILPIDPWNMDSENAGTLTDDQRTQSIDADIGIKVNDAVPKLQPQTSGEMELVNNVDPHPETSPSAALDDHTDNARGKQAMTGLCHSDDGREEDATRISSDTYFRSQVDSVSGVQASVAADNDATPLSGSAAESPETVEKSNDVSSSRSPSVAVINSLYSDDLQAHLDGDKSSLKGSVNDNLVSGGIHEVTMMKAEVEKESAQSAEVDKASCGSPTIISSSEPSQMEKDKQEEGRGSEVTDKFVKDIQFTSEGPQTKDSLGDDTSFTFKVNALPETTEIEPGKSWSPFPTTEKHEPFMVPEEIMTSGKGKTEKKPSQKTPRQSSRVSDGKPVRGTPKVASERKGKRASTKGMEKENAKKRNQPKDTNQESISVKGDKFSNIMLSSPSSSPDIQFGKMTTYGNIDQMKVKLSGAVSVPTSNLPDINTSALNNSTFPSATFRQPFTDLQQVQLRAQIFVYGSLIQGTAPDEACMVSAFGPSDGGRSIWERVWRASVERVRSQKSNSSAGETPLHSQSSSRTSDAAVKLGFHSSNVLSSPVSRASTKGTPTVNVNPVMPLSSPIWSITTPSRDSLPTSGMHKGLTVDYQHAISPSHSYQTTPIKNFVGHTSWPSQTCFPGPWLASPQTSTLNSSIRFQPVTTIETVKLTPVKDTSGPLTSGMKHITSSPVVHTVGPSPIFLGMSPPGPKSIASAEQHSVDPKPRKRKKVSLVSEARIEPVVVSNIATVLSSPFATLPPACPASDPVLSEANVGTSAVCSIDCPKIGGGTEETLSKVAEAKSHAEDAAALATAAVTHSEYLWSRLAKQKDSGLTSEVEAKIATSAVTIAAAASVAKAAAAAAKVAYNAALQAKLMADDTFLPSETSGLLPFSGKSSVGDISNQSSSILVAAKEAAKKRVEEASSASKQAENLDAIVKAAELAAKAVSQAGKIVAMVEPLPLCDLIEAGPEGYWKLPQHPPEVAEKPKDWNKDKAIAVGVEKGADIPAKVFGDESVEKGGSRIVGHGKMHPIERSNDSADGHSSLVDGVKEGNVDSGHDELEGTLPEDSIKESSLVEVFKHGDGLKSAWYSAKVLTLEDGKAYVCYNDLLSDEGSGNLREWVPLGGEGDKAPVIRPSHPFTALQFKATRKRHRTAMEDYAWCVGDRVDVWINDCWLEGVVVEKNEKDETTLKVHLPARGETSIVKAWNLRTSRSWSDGKWVEFSSFKGHDASQQRDTPQEKRQKLGSPAVATGRKDKLSDDANCASEKPEEPKLLALSTRERIFDIGKTIKEDNKRAAHRPLRSGQQKERSRVIIGGPNPDGKKRKFMEVSKHFPANKSDKSNEANDPVKFAKYLMPQATASRGWRAPLKKDSKEKRILESKPRVPSSRKPHRALPQGDNLKLTTAQDNDNDNAVDNGTEIENSVGHDEIVSEKLTEAPLSSLLAPTVSTSSKKITSSNTKFERLTRGKVAHPGGKLRKIEEKIDDGNSSKEIPDTTEPRRSNRRIQPTHRLLEGWQSAMIIPKMPSVSHDKGQKNQSRNVSARGK